MRAFVSSDHIGSSSRIFRLKQTTSAPATRKSKYTFPHEDMGSRSRSQMVRSGSPAALHALHAEAMKLRNMFVPPTPKRSSYPCMGLVLRPASRYPNERPKQSVPHDEEVGRRANKVRAWEENSVKATLKIICDC